VALNVRDVSIVEMTGRKVAIVILSLLAHRHEKVLTGSCTVEQDTPQAVVLATLAALNRIVAGMRAKERTGYGLAGERHVSEFYKRGRMRGRPVDQGDERSGASTAKRPPVRPRGRTENPLKGGGLFMDLLLEIVELLGKAGW